MPEQEIDSLRERWEADRSPVLTLQLADGYKARDEGAEALLVLTAGVEAHPEHVATRVAKGRFHLEMGEADEAARDLERVVLADPAHLLANKLLVDAYTRLGNLTRARDRLDLYALLSSGDPDLETLETGLAAAAEAPEPQIPFEPAAAASPATAESEPFDLPAASPPQALAVNLAEPDPGSRARRIEVGGDPEPFADLGWMGMEASNYRAALFGEGLFASTAAAAETQTPVASEPAPADGQDLAATLTLAELYRKQGHDREAADIYREVLERQPGNAQAARALQELGGGQSWPLSAEDLLGEAGSTAGGSSRGEMLKRYRERLRPKK